MPVIAFSATSHDHIIQAAYGFGANLYIMKPQEYSLLKATLRHVLSINWNDPKIITARHFYQNKYILFVVTY
jgi:DNA-binding NarL/FixJ family response regulator